MALLLFPILAGLKVARYQTLVARADYLDRMADLLCLCLVCQRSVLHPMMERLAIERCSVQLRQPFLEQPLYQLEMP